MQGFARLWTRRVASGVMVMAVVMVTTRAVSVAVLRVLRAGGGRRVVVTVIMKTRRGDRRRNSGERSDGSDPVSHDMFHQDSLGKPTTGQSLLSVRFSPLLPRKSPVFLFERC